MLRLGASFHLLSIVLSLFSYCWCDKMLTLGASFHLPSIALSLASWSSLYFGLRGLQPQVKAEWHCRTVTVVHASLVTLMTAWACFLQGPWPFTDAGGPNTPLQVTTTIVCLGYFIFDFAWCLYFQTEGFPMLLHHSLSVFGFVWTLCSGKYGTELMATVCGSEVTNPLLQLRWFLRETGRYHTALGEAVDVVFMLSFLAVRLGVGSVLMVCYFRQPTEFMGRVGALSIYLISWMFSVDIARYALRKYSKKLRARPEGKPRSHQSLSSSETGGQGLASSSSCSQQAGPSPSAVTAGGNSPSSSKSRAGSEGVGNAEDASSSSSTTVTRSCECVVGQGARASSDVSSHNNGLHRRSGLHVCGRGEASGPGSSSLTDQGVRSNGVPVNS